MDWNPDWIQKLSQLLDKGPITITRQKRGSVAYVTTLAVGHKQVKRITPTVEIAAARTDVLAHGLEDLLVQMIEHLL